MLLIKRSKAKKQKNKKMSAARTAEQDLRRFDNPPDATSEIPGSKQEASGIALESSSQVVTRL